MPVLSDPWMASLISLVLMAHAISFAVFGAVLLMFRRTQHRRATLIQSLALSAEEDDAALRYVHSIERRQKRTLVTYGVLAVLIALLTIPLFVFQPHVL